jgi:hypothetical protein
MRSPDSWWVFKGRRVVVCTPSVTPGSSLPSAEPRTPRSCEWEAPRWRPVSPPAANSKLQRGLFVCGMPGTFCGRSSGACAASGGSDANCDLVPDETTVRGLRRQRVLLRNQHHELLIDCASPPEIDKPDLKSRSNLLSFGYYQHPKLVPYLLMQNHASGQG